MNGPRSLDTPSYLCTNSHTILSHVGSRNIPHEMRSGANLMCCNASVGGPATADPSGTRAQAHAHHVARQSCAPRWSRRTRRKNKKTRRLSANCALQSSPAKNSLPKPGLPNPDPIEALPLRRDPNRDGEVDREMLRLCRFSPKRREQAGCV